MKFSTKAVFVAEEPNLSGKTSSGVVSSIHLASTFAKPDFENTIRGLDILD